MTLFNVTIYLLAYSRDNRVPPGCYGLSTKEVVQENWCEKDCCSRLTKAMQLTTDVCVNGYMYRCVTDEDVTAGPVEYTENYTVVALSLCAVLLVLIIGIYIYIRKRKQSRTYTYEPI